MPRVSPSAKARLEGARRTQILAAAALVFARKGFDRATVTEIARAAGLAEGSIYNYFRSKEELLVHIPRQLAQPVLAALLDHAPKPATAEEMEALLLNLASGMVERVRTHAKFLKVFFSALPYLSPAARETYMQLLPVYGAAALEGILREGIRAGYLRRDLNPVIAARVLPGMLMFILLVQEVLTGRRMVPYDYDEVIPEAVRVFLYGAVPRRQRVAGKVR
jgi:TetR/AcrR family fatty acid metabolism transcriptional regulator